ncbi:glycosyltransferase family 2 protein [Candidatus Pelagibacter sp.]|uniref:glycosyltransferase family 2 protein n=1 Tax=Candidatus Pelagibacter sp. TaxID=2024849 RepID=UPI003F87D11F
MDITLAILNFNRSKFLDRSLRSCLDQVLSNKSIEVIVIDDASTDESLKYLKGFEKYIKIYRNKKNMGAGYSSKLAVKKSKGKYFIRVDSDDYLNKYSVQIMSEILDFNRNLAFVYADHYRVDEYGFKQKIIKLNSKKKILSHGAGIMFRTQMIKKIGNYNPKLREAEDHDLINRLMKKYQTFHLPIPLYRYYIHGKNISFSGNRKQIINKLKK